MDYWGGFKGGIHCQHQNRLALNDDFQHDLTIVCKGCLLTRVTSINNTY